MYVGQEVYDGVGMYPLQIKGVFQNNTQPGCSNYCEFHMKEYDNDTLSGNLDGTINSDFSKVEGTFTKPDGTGSSSFSLTKTDPYNIYDYLKAL